MERLPSGKFETNALVLELTVIAYNILRMIGQGTIGKRAPRQKRFEDDCDVCEDEDRPMGSEITYSFDWPEYECSSCRKEMHISGYICEYPVGVYNYEDINVEAE